MTIAFSKALTQGSFETWIEKPEFPLIHAHQVHGIDIVSPETLPCEADGLIVSHENFSLPLAIKTADCLPVVIEGNKGVVFLHAGWKGLATGILERPEIGLIDPRNAFVGPSIHECCFEVSEDFKNNFIESPFFKNIQGKFFFNLQEEAKRRLKALYPELIVQIAPQCTCCDLKFHSYRRDKTTLRNWNLYRKG